MKIAVDFDNVICYRKGIPAVQEEWAMRKPVEGALDAVKLMMGQGHEVWVFTSNPELENVRSWLELNGFPELKVTNIKKFANVYIDDRALRFTNWNDIRKYFV